VTKRCSLSFSPLREVVHLLGKRTRATGGLILLDRQDNSGFAFNPRMAYSYVAPDGPLLTAVWPGDCPEVVAVKGFILIWSE